MNTKLLALLGTTATLVLSTGWVFSMEAKPLSTASDQSMVLAQGKRAALNLTDQQKTQMRQIREATRAQIDSILTPEQRDKIKATREQREQNRQVWSSLNLTEDQKAQIKRIREESRQKMQAILTQEQQQQLQQMRQNHQNRRPPQ